MNGDGQRQVFCIAAKAIGYWERVLMVLDPGSNDSKQVLAEIEDARAKGGITKP